MTWMTLSRGGLVELLIEPVDTLVGQPIDDHLVVSVRALDAGIDLILDRREAHRLLPSIGIVRSEKVAVPVQPASYHWMLADARDVYFRCVIHGKSEWNISRWADRICVHVTWHDKFDMVAQLVLWLPADCHGRLIDAFSAA